MHVVALSYFVEMVHLASQCVMTLTKGHNFEVNVTIDMHCFSGRSEKQDGHPGL